MEDLMKRFLLLIAIVLVLSTNPAQAQLGFHSINPQISVVLPENHDLGFGAGVSADMGEVTSNLHLAPFAHYWTAGWENYDDGSTSNIALGADVRYALDNLAPGFYAGGGLSINFVSSEWEYDNPFTGGKETVDNSDTEIGFSGLAGYEMMMGNNSFFGEVRYNSVDVFDNFQFIVGMKFNMN